MAPSLTLIEELPPCQIPQPLTLLSPAIRRRAAPPMSFDILLFYLRVDRVALFAGVQSARNGGVEFEYTRE
jgi:hypothetical protein